MARKVTKDEAAAHEARAWSLRQRGWTQDRIAAEIGVEQPAVSRALKRVRERLYKELSARAEALKADQQATLEHVLDEALQAWERSRRPTVTVEEEHAAKRTVTVEQPGDPVFLKEARAALADIRDVWGLDAPAQQEAGGGVNVLVLGGVDLAAMLGQRAGLHAPAPNEEAG